ncbi:MAG: NADH-quinone oxidoreductase subunit C [Methanomassiliicoccus sp.]|nr:NADH-quinone oxidoreductase subunit C [Methanomassiliicoccus sp.]
MTEGTNIPDFDRDAYHGVRERVREHTDAGARMITIAAREEDDGRFELIYLFDRDGRMVNFRFHILPDWEVDSVADIYRGALNMEREAVDLFGLKFKGVRPGLFLEEGKSPVAPLRKKRDGKKEGKGGEADG